MKLNDNIKIDWHHSVSDKITSCVLTVTIVEGVLSYPKEFIAIAKCHDKDKFSRQAGRKLSFLRVLEKADLNREARVFIWDALRTRGVKL